MVVLQKACTLWELESTPVPDCQSNWHDTDTKTVVILTDYFEQRIISIIKEHIQVLSALKTLISLLHWEEMYSVAISG